MAVAGFSEAESEITAKESTLFIDGKQREREDVIYLHCGIAGRAFERRFELADHIKVTDANLANGLLQIELIREEPEEKKAKSRVPIRSSTRVKDWWERIRGRPGEERLPDEEIEELRMKEGDSITDPTANKKKMPERTMSHDEDNDDDDDDDV